jgi:hypothetical protein
MFHNCFCHNFVGTTLPDRCSLPEPRHFRDEWGNVLIARLSGDLYFPSLLQPPSNIEGPTTHSDLGRIPSQPTTQYSSSTIITEAKENIKTILATCVSFNNPNIVNVLIKPDEVNDHSVKTMEYYISKDQVIMDSLNDVHYQTVQLERDMYEPLVRRNCYSYFKDSRFD